MKTCFKCHQEKPLSDFYKHPMMGDGHLNKCKECARREAELRRQEKMKDPEWVAKEMERCRKKQKSYVLKNPEKTEARATVNRAISSGELAPKPCEICGEQKVEAHHDDYSKPLSVRWLCRKHHNDHHKELKRLEHATMLEVNHHYRPSQNA